MGARYAVQRSNRVRLKADCAALLDKIVKTGATVDDLFDEIAEMKVRLHPPTGAAAPIVLTGYTKGRKKRGPAPEVPVKWTAEAVMRRPVDGMDERFGTPLDSMRYRKD